MKTKSTNNYPPINLLREKVIAAHKASDKRHLLITGSKGAGKTTLIKELLKDRKDYGGLITRLIHGTSAHPKHLLLEDILDSKTNIIIGRINKAGNRMIPDISAFENLPVNILKEYRASQKSLIVIDEIGYLEESAEKYLEEVYKCFKEKNIIAAIRKESNPFLDKILTIENTLLIDLDTFNT